MNPFVSSRSSMTRPVLTPVLAMGIALIAGCASAPDADAPPMTDCSDTARFELALNDRPVPPACSVMAPDEAYALGEMIGEHRRQIERLQRRLAGDLPRAERVRARQQLIGLQRDLPELEALARFEGWLPPAELPGGRGGDSGN